MAGFFIALFLSTSSGRSTARGAVLNGLTSSWGRSERSSFNDPLIYNEFVHYVYVLQSSKNPRWLYKGSTSDLKRRLAEHNSGKNFSTAPYAPLKLIYYEAYLLKLDAEAREKYLKTSMGMRVIKKQLASFLKMGLK